MDYEYWDTKGVHKKASTYPYALLFSIDYLAVSIIYGLLYYRIHNTPFFQFFLFATSPFSPLEDFSRIYSSVTVGLISNFFVVALLILISEIIADFVLKNGKSYVRTTFVYSILSSYILSFIIFVLLGTPSTGTSIIGFCFSILIAYMLLSEVYSILHRIAGGPQQMTIKGLLNHINFVVMGLFKVIIFGAFVYVLAVFTLYSYIIGNPSWWLHLSGAAVFAALVLASNGKHVLKKPKGKRR